MDQSFLLQPPFSPSSQLRHQVIGALHRAVYGVRERKSLEGYQDGVISVSFSPDSSRISTASNDNTAKLWRVEGVNELLVRGCKRVREYLENDPEIENEQEKRQLCQGIGGGVKSRGCGIRIVVRVGWGSWGSKESDSPALAKILK